jgi:hypothetical protein
MIKHILGIAGVGVGAGAVYELLSVFKQFIA